MPSQHLPQILTSLSTSADGTRCISQSPYHLEEIASQPHIQTGTERTSESIISNTTQRRIALATTGKMVLHQRVVLIDCSKLTAQTSLLDIAKSNHSYSHRGMTTKLLILILMSTSVILSSMAAILSLLELSSLIGSGSLLDKPS